MSRRFASSSLRKQWRGGTAGAASWPSVAAGGAAFDLIHPPRLGAAGCCWLLVGANTESGPPAKVGHSHRSVTVTAGRAGAISPGLQPTTSPPAGQVSGRPGLMAAVAQLQELHELQEQQKLQELRKLHELLHDDLLVEVLQHLAAAGPCKDLCTAAASCHRWHAVAADPRVWARVYSRLFHTNISEIVLPASATAAAAADAGLSPSARTPPAPQLQPCWRSLCQARLRTASLAEGALRTPPPVEVGAPHPVHARVLEGALDPLLGTRDTALASPQARRVASLVHEGQDEPDYAMLIQLGECLACMVTSREALAPLPALQKLTGRSIAYFECRFRGGGSVGIVSPEAAAEGWVRDGGRSHVGWHGVSYGYHSDDGEVYYNDDGSGEQYYRHASYGPAYGTSRNSGMPHGTMLVMMMMTTTMMSPS
jgi:hypothetical protein